MAQTKGKSNKKYYSKNFICVFDQGDDYVTFSVRRRKTRRKDADEDVEIGVIKYFAIDEYSTSDMLINFSDGLSVEEFKEILNLTNDYVWSQKCLFISVCNIVTPINTLTEALYDMGFVVDSLDGKLVLRIEYTQLMPLGMMFGLSLGVCYSSAFHYNLALGMCVGMALGLLYGTFIDFSRKQKLDEATRKRENRNNRQN